MAITFDDVRSVATGFPRVRHLIRLLRELPTIPLVILGVLAFVAVFADVLAPHSELDPVIPTSAQCLERYGTASCPYIDEMPPFWSEGGSFATPLGTDFLGRDVLSRLMYGARISLVVALIGTLVAGTIGTLLGVLAGYLGRWWDQIIMRVTDAWLTLPSLVFEREAETVRRLRVEPEKPLARRYSPVTLGLIAGAVIVTIAFAISFMVATLVT